MKLSKILGLVAAMAVVTTVYGADASGAAQTLAELRTMVADAAEGATVKLAEGTYTSDDTFALVLEKAVHVEAAGAKAKTVIKLASGKAGIKVAYGGASVSGITIDPNGQGVNAIVVSAGTVTNCVVSGAKSTVSTILVSGTGVLDDVQVLPIEVSVQVRGGAVNQSGGIVRNCLFRGVYNTVQAQWGTAAYVTGGLMENCTIEECESHGINQQDGCKGSLYMEGTGEVRNCTVRNNGVRSGCAGVYLASGTFHDSVVYGNMATNVYAMASGGAGVRVCGAKALMYNCRVARNCTLFDTAKHGYSGVHISAGVVSNCVVYGNLGGDIYKSGGTVKYTCSGNAVEGEGNFVADPQFRNPQADDYTLLPTSPCAEESETAAIGFSAGATQTKLVDGLATVSFTACKNAISEALTYSWDFGDGTSGTGAAVSHEYTTAGDFAVTISAGAYSCTRTIRIIPPVCHVWVGGSNTAPYDTKEKAATTFATAYNYGSDEIDVHPGTYSCLPSLSCTAVGRAVHVKGIGAASEVVFTGMSKNNNRAMAVGHPDAIVENVTLTGGQTYHNYGGSGVYIGAGLVTNCVITKNSHYYYGAVYMSSGRLTGCQVLKNEAIARSNYGGGVYVEGDAKVDNCRIEGNTAQGTGATAMRIIGDNCVVSNCTITGNSASILYGTGATDGGTVRLEKGLMVNCLVSANTLPKGVAAGVYLGGGTLRGCVIAKNSYNAASVGTGGGVYITGGTMESCTVSGNAAASSSTPGSGVYQAGGAVLNSIVYGNTTDDFNYQSGTVTYTCAKETLTGTGNVASDPSFVNAASGDYHLTTLSKAVVNKGLNQDWMDGATDLDGTNRIVNTTVDMGAFEFVPPTDVPFTVSFEASSISGNDPLDVTFTAQITKYEVSDCTFTWTFSDGTTTNVVGSATIDHQFSAGTFSATLVVTKGAESCSQTRENYIKVKPRVCYVSKEGSNTPPYTSWETASHNVEDALDMGAATIYIGDGVYEVTNTLNLSTAVHLIGNGRENVRIRRATSLKADGAPSFPVMIVNNDAAVVEGVTVSHGYLFTYAREGGSNVRLLKGTVKDCWIEKGNGYPYGACQVSDGILSNTVIDDNYGCGNWVYGAGLTQLGGTVVGCTISRNHDYGCGGQEYGDSYWPLCQGAYIAGGVMSNCTITANYGLERNGTCGGIAMGGGLVTHCFITNNTVVGRTGGVMLKSGTLRNSLIAGNVSGSTDASYGGGAGVTQLGGTIENCTITKNSGTVAGSGLKSVDGSVVNTIVYGNVGGADFDNAGDVPVTTSLFADPLFVGEGDYRLTDFSPAVDAAMSNDWMVGVTDLAGVSRIIGSAPDIGAYELDSAASGLLCHFDVTSSVRGADYNTTATFAAKVRGNQGQAVTYYWTFGDGTAETEGTATPSHVYAPGKYTVKLRVVCGEDEATVTRENVVVAIPHEVTVAAGESIADAIDSGADIVWLAAGTHAITEEIVLTRAVEVKSVSGNPADTIIEAPSTISRLRVMQLMSADAKLSGVTLRGGNMQVPNEYVPGSLLWIQNGTVEDCVLENGLSYYRANVWLDGGTLRRAIIRNCRTTSSSTCGVGLGMTAGLAENCVISNNVAATIQGWDQFGAGVYLKGTAQVRNLLVTGNTATQGAGVHVAAKGLEETIDTDVKIENCTIVGNTGAAPKDKSSSAGGVYVADGATAAIVNTIVWGNTADTNADINDATPFSYSCASGLKAGVNGNIASDPQFKTRKGHPYQLAYESPCIDVGEKHDWMEGATDLLGKVRIYNQKGEAALPDMGCYETALKGTILILR